MALRNPAVYLLHIRDCGARLNECLTLFHAGAAPEHILLDAACRNLEILGEASRKVGAEFRIAHPSLPWREMNDLRNVLIHNYEGVEPAMIWGVLEREIPLMQQQILRLLEDHSL